MGGGPPRSTLFPYTTLFRSGVAVAGCRGGVSVSAWRRSDAAGDCITRGGIVKKLIVFDLDGTLAESKSPIDGEMLALLHDLLGIVKVAIISGGDWPQFETQVLSHLPLDQRLADLSLLPTCGTKFYRYEIGRASCRE